MLHWHQIIRNHEPAGELLAAFELIPASDVPLFPLPAPVTISEDCTKRRKVGVVSLSRALICLQNVIHLPKDIRPVTELARIDVLAWGLRSLVKTGLHSISCPSIQVECGGIMVETGRLTDIQRHLNFKGLTRQSGRCIFAVDFFDFDAALGRPCTVTDKVTMDNKMRTALQKHGLTATYFEYSRNTVAAVGPKPAIEKLHNAIEEGDLTLEINGQVLRVGYGTLGLEKVPSFRRAFPKPALHPIAGGSAAAQRRVHASPGDSCCRQPPLWPQAYYRRA